MRTNAHDYSQHLNHKQHKEPDHTKDPNSYRALMDVEEALLENTKIYSKSGFS